MGAGRSSSGNTPGGRTVKVRIYRLLDPTRYLPKHQNGGPLPFELVAYQQYHESRAHWDVSSGSSTPAADGPAKTIVRVDLSQILTASATAASSDKPDEIDLSFTVTDEPGSHHFIASRVFQGKSRNRVAVVIRPKAGYAFVASYLSSGRQPVTRRHRIDCYHMRLVRLTRPIEAWTFVKDIAFEEFQSLDTGVCAPWKARFKLGPPLLTRQVSDEASDAIRREWVPSTGGESVRFDLAQLKTLSRHNSRRALDILGELRRQLPERRGRRALPHIEHRPEIFHQVVRACELILAESRNQRWPMFRRRALAKAAVETYFIIGPNEVERVVDVFVKGQRRPSARALATRILLALMGRSRTRPSAPSRQK